MSYKIPAQTESLHKNDDVLNRLSSEASSLFFLYPHILKKKSDMLSPSIHQSPLARNTISSFIFCTNVFMFGTMVAYDM